MFPASLIPLVMKHNKSVSCFLAICYILGLCYQIPFHFSFHLTFSLSFPRLNPILIHSWGLIFNFCALLVPSSGFFPTFPTFLIIIQDFKIIILVPRSNKFPVMTTCNILPKKSQISWICHCFRLLAPNQVLIFDSLLLFFKNTDILHYHPFKLHFFFSCLPKCIFNSLS